MRAAASPAGVMQASVAWEAVLGSSRCATCSVAWEAVLGSSRSSTSSVAWEAVLGSSCSATGAALVLGNQRPLVEKVEEEG